MLWLTRWWPLLRDLALTGGGLAVIGSQVALAYLPDGQPSPYLIGAGLSLTIPSTYAKIRQILSAPSAPGGPELPPPPPGPEPSPLPSASDSK